MKKLYLTAPIAALLLLANNGSCNVQATDAQTRQAQATTQGADAADREAGYPRLINYAQKKLLKNAYEDMDQTTLTYVYVQGMDGKFVCLGQALGYGVSLGTQFTAPYVNKTAAGGAVYEDPQPEPNQLYTPTSGAATIVDLINPKNGEAHTAVMEPNIVTVPFELASSAVTVPCPEDIDPAKVVDAKEKSLAAYH